MTYTEDLLTKAAEVEYHAACLKTTPAAVYRPRIFIDGNQWCALYGENLQDGVAGFGDSPAHAMAEFNRAWHESLDRT